VSEGKGKGRNIAVLIWCAVVAVLAVAYRVLIHPYFQERLAEDTSSESPYESEIRLAADSFTGYCFLRSEDVRNELRARKIRLSIQDDGADYVARMQALRDGRIDMAVFTVDSLLVAGARVGTVPATIVMVIDESKGADALLAYKSALASIQDLDDPSARIVATPNSPSEFLARVVLAHFSLPRMSKDWLIEADGAADAYSRMRSAKPEEKRAFVMWEPQVSRALALPNAHVLLDSSKMSGLIVDVLVAERRYLRDHPDLVRALLEAYFRALHRAATRSDGMVERVREDAAAGEERLNEEQARKLAATIQWKNTLENYAHFGLLSEQETKGIQHIDDVVANVTDILVRTGALPDDPLGGKRGTIYYDKVLRDMRAAEFHPAKGLNVLTGVGLGEKDLEQVRTAPELPPLPEERWEQLVEVGEMRIKPISFARGTARVNVQSERELEELAKRLRALPQYYLVVVGNARAEGDAQANLELARERADAAAKFLFEKGVSRNRVRVKAAPPASEDGSAQSVSFMVGVVPY
jgi:outer membrane protein OmpA-like peptidoglycan-associated protein/ABC-type nitrate/sulfonate/bicarbonate transport system substrate-binding protein